MMRSHGLVLPFVLATAAVVLGQPQLVAGPRNLGEPVQAEPRLRAALLMQQRLMEAALAGASEAEALNLLAPRRR